MTQDTNPQDKVKTIATDTGRRIEVNNKPSTTLRRRSDQQPKKPKIFAKDNYEESFETIKKTDRSDAIDHIAPITQTKIVCEKVEFDDSGDFLSLLLENEHKQEVKNFNIGDKVNANVVHIGPEYIFVSLGAKVEGFIDKSEFEEELSIGQVITAYVVSFANGVCLSKRISKDNLDEESLKEAYEKQIPVQGKVVLVSKGGYETALFSKKAFCPLGQIDDKFINEPNDMIGKIYDFLIERIEESGRNIVVSRRKLLQKQNAQKAALLLNDLEVGKVVSGVVSKICDFGAFVDIGGIEGLIPKSELSYSHVGKVLDVVSSNDKVNVAIISLEKNLHEPQKTKISFSLKQTKEDPYTLHWHKLNEGLVMEGKVVRLESFGAFVELFAGIEGLLHISEFSEERILHPNEVLNVGDPLTVMILNLDHEQKRISLSLREILRKKKKQEQATSASSLTRGQKVSAVVSRIEKYGVFVQLDNGASALLPASETGMPKSSDLSSNFKIGTKLDLVIIDIDRDNRIKVSSIARKEVEERDTFLEFSGAQNKKASFGTLADLFNKKK